MDLVSLHPSLPIVAEFVEIWFVKITRDVSARGVFTSTAKLSRRLMKYIRAYVKGARILLKEVLERSPQNTRNDKNGLLDALDNDLAAVGSSYGTTDVLPVRADSSPVACMTRSTRVR